MADIIKMADVICLVFIEQSVAFKKWVSVCTQIFHLAI